MKAVRRTFMAGFACLLAMTWTVAYAVPPGEYITKGGWGWMSIGRDASQAPGFSLYSHGPNGHLCGLGGAIYHDLATINPGGGEPICKVSLRPTARGVLVGSENTCRGFCGMRASFDGEYLLVSRNCTRGAKTKAGTAFVARYRAAQYQDAIAYLRRVLTDCAETLEAAEEARLRNDLAVAYFHARDRRGCMAMLAPLIGSAADREFEQLSLLPAEFETWSAIRAMVQTNVRLCASLA